MKNLLLLCFFFFLITSSKAQFEKGQKMIGGQFSFYDQNIQANSVTPKSNSSSINASFSLSNFTSPTLFKGFGFNYGYGDNATNYISSSIGAFYNCTKLEKLANRFYLTFGGTAAINYSETNTSANFAQDKNKQTSITPSISLGLGLLYHLNNRFLLSASLVNLASLSYSFNESKIFPNWSTSYNTKSNTFNLNSGLNGFNLYNVAFGFKYLLKK
jgi:hypothetical protein